MTNCALRKRRDDGRFFDGRSAWRRGRRELSAIRLERQRRLRQSGAGKGSQQARVEPAFLLDIGRIPHYRLYLATVPVPEVGFGRRTQPHPGNVVGNLVGHRGHLGLPPARDGSGGRLADRGFHDRILRHAPLDGDARAADRWMRRLNAVVALRVAAFTSRSLVFALLMVCSNGNPLVSRERRMKRYPIAMAPVPPWPPRCR